MNVIILFVDNIIHLFMMSAPWLLFGFCVAGIFKAIIPLDVLQRHLGTDSMGSVVKAALLGAPLPLCSCGVIPAAMGLRKAGASRAATTSFLISTPETGVDSLLVTYALLGPVMTVVRPVAALVTAISTGAAVLLLVDNKKNSNNDTLCSNNACSGSSNPTKTAEERERDTCCSQKQPSQSEVPSRYARIAKVALDGVQFTFVDLLKDTVVWLLLGFISAALIMTFVPGSLLSEWGNSPYAYMVMAVIGVPMYICATASTPIAASLLFAGVSPGAVLVFLLVGPATNMATLAMVGRELGRSVLVIYLVAIVVLSSAFGLVVDWLGSPYMAVAHASANDHDRSANVLMVASSVILLLLLVNALVRKYPSKN